MSESINEVTGANTSANGSTTRWKALGLLPEVTAGVTKAAMLMIKNKATVCLSGQTVANMKAVGLTANNMGVDFITQLMEIKKKGSGKMANELNG